jgi:ArsR family transcriptional regulator, zinc-responsive transcriptional repressor
MSAEKQQCRRPLPADHVDLAVEVFRMLADATRIRILWALIGQELSVNEVAAEVGKMPAPVASRWAFRSRTRSSAC